MKSLDLKLSQKVLVLVTVPIVFMLVFVTTLAILQKQAEDEVYRERHAKAVIAECDTLMHNIMDCGLYMYLYGNTKQRSFLKQYEDLRAQFVGHFGKLEDLMQGNPEVEGTLRQLKQAKLNVFKIMDEADQMVQRGIEGGHKDFESQAEFLNVSRELVANLRAVAKQHQETADNSQAETRLRKMTQISLVAGIVFSIILAVTLAVFFNRSTTNRLLLLVDNTFRVATGKPLNEKLDGGDEIAHLDGVFHDMADALADAARRKQELIQMVTHDLRTPMTSIDASLRIMMSGLAGELPEKATKRVTVAKRSSERLLNLINDLLDIERLETGNFPLNRAETSARQLIESSVESVRALAGEKGITLKTVEFDMDVFADPARVEQVLVNLLSNAIKFSPDGASVEAEVSQEGDDAEFRVVDHGRGVPEEYKTVIFERFGQVKKEDSERGKGTGLGLPICKALVEAHGGSIGVRSKEGEGSTFWFRIPRVKD